GTGPSGSRPRPDRRIGRHRAVDGGVGGAARRGRRAHHAPPWHAAGRGRSARAPRADALPHGNDGGAGGGVLAPRGHARHAGRDRDPPRHALRAHRRRRARDPRRDGRLRALPFDEPRDPRRRGAGRGRDMKYLDEASVRAVLIWEPLTDAMAAALAAFSSGRVLQPVRNMLTIEESKRYLGIMPAVTEEAMGLKLVSFYPGNAGT